VKFLPVLVSFLALTATLSAAENLQSVRPVTDEVSIQGAKVNLEIGIPRPTVQILYGLLSQEARSGHRPSIYRVPQFSKLYAVTADVPYRFCRRQRYLPLYL
jgi:hypothetical protein